MNAALEFVRFYGISDFASIFELLVTLVGFAVTLWNVRRSRRLAEQTSRAVEAMKDDIARLHTLSDLSAAVTTLEEVKRLHRDGAWSLLPDRYSSLKRSLIGIRHTNPDLSEKHKALLQGAIEQFRSLESKAETALAAKTAPPDVAKLNRVVSRQIDSLSEVFVALRNRVGLQGSEDGLRKDR